MKLKDQVAVVTGASGGIGRDIALALAQQGATVVCHYGRSAARAEKLAGDIIGSGGSAIACGADICDYAAVEQMMQSVIERYDRVDILVNNAGINRDELILSMPIEDWKAVIDTNLTGAFYCTRAVAQQMTFQKRGRIINISSVAGDRGGRGQSNYAASKGGLNAFTRAAAVELARKKVTVNAVAPGVIETDMSQEVLRRARDTVMEHIALKRLGKPSEVAAMVVFLASDEAAYITGQVISVDGGFRG